MNLKAVKDVLQLDQVIFLEPYLDFFLLSGGRVKHKMAQIIFITRF